ncbi:rab11 family-interacting protein 1 isoform X2 [Elgaria multicarinata webbii]
MRSNMTASMLDLSMKDKSRTPFGKLKDKWKGKRGNGFPDTASAIIPSISHSPADSDEESTEKEKKKSKFKTLFSKHGLQKSNISQSMSVLPTLQPVSEKVRLKPSDFPSQWSDDDDDDTLTPVSEKPSANRGEDNFLYPPSSKSHKRTGSGDSKQLNQITTSNTKKDSHSLFGGLKSKSDPISRSNVCINGSHVYMEECESKSDTIPRESTPSSPSPHTSQRKRLFLSQENLSSEPSKEPEVSGRLPLDKGPPGSSSLESFKAMTLPSYKLLSGGDLLESSTPVISDTPKETKENKKQENKKPGLLSLVTVKKEAKISEEVKNSDDASLKEVKRNEKELARKETNPFEVPVDSKRGHGSDKSSASEVPIAKAALNPFHENIVAEEKPEKSAASVKPSQTKPIKPRPDVSSEDETKATFTIPVSSSASPFYHFLRSDNENNPFTSKLEAEQKAQDSDKVASSSLNLSAKHSNNPFTTKWGQISKEQASKAFVVASSTSGNENNPFAPKWGQESQIEDSENSAKSSLHSLHSPATAVFESHPLPSQLSNVANLPASKPGKDSENFKGPPESLTSISLAGNLDDSMHLHVVHSGTPQDEGLTNQIDPVSSFPGSASGSHSARFYDRVGLILKTQCDDKVQVVPPFKEKSERIKKSVTFALDELKDDDTVSSGDEASDEDPVERGNYGENEDAVNPTERNSRRQLELDVGYCSASKPHDGIINSDPNDENPLERETETSSVITIEPPVPVPRVLMPLPKETSMSSTASGSSSLSVPPKPAPRSALKQKQSTCLPLSDESKTEDVLNSASVFKELPSNSLVSSERLTSACSLAGSESTVLQLGRNVGTTYSQSISNHSSHGISTHLGILVTGEMNVNPIALPVIPEVGSDDEQLSDCHQDADKMAACEDLSRNRDEFTELSSSTERRELASNEKVAGEGQTVSLVKISGPNDAPGPNKPLVNPSAVVLQSAGHNERGLEQKNGDKCKEDRHIDCPEFSDKPVPLSPLSGTSQSYPTSSFQSDALGSNRAETPKKAAAEGLDAKGEISGKKKLLEARVSPSETHPNQTLQSGGTYPAKLRLHPVKPMNATTNKLSITTKILDNQNESNLKKYDPSDPAYAYAQLTHDELIQLVLKQKDAMAKRDLQVRELEDYIDNLLVRVMEETPNILRAQAHVNKKAGKI